VEFDASSNRVIGCAIEVHRVLGPGLLESAYRQCLTHELTSNGIACVAEHVVPIDYKGLRLDCGYRVDLLVENTLIVELKSVEHVLPVHEAQLLTYMKLMGVRIGLLLNFNVAQLRHGIKRYVL